MAKYSNNVEKKDNTKPIKQNNTQDNKHNKATVRTRSGRQIKRPSKFDDFVCK